MEMTNREKYLDELLATLPWMVHDNGTIHFCNKVDCKNCIFDEESMGNCPAARKRWLESEAKPEVDWSQVPIDTQIWVRDSETDEWALRYFAKYQDGLVYAWDYGTTSWSSLGRMVSWNYAELAERRR